MPITDLKQKPYQYFTVKLLALLVIVVVLDFAVGSALRYFYFRQSSGLQYRTTYALEKTNEEVLIFGSSRANHHYVTSDFEKGLGMSCYNTGRDGQFIFYHYALLKSILTRYTPKLIILDFSASDLYYDPKGYDRLTNLLPYYKHHPEIRSIVELKGPMEKWKLYSSIYPFNSSLFTIAVGNASFNKKRREDIKGYVPLYVDWKAPIQKLAAPEAPFKVDSTKLSMLEAFIRDCQSRHISLYIVSSPIFRTQLYQDPYNELVKNIAAKHRVPFLDHLQDSSFLHSKDILFADISHLNHKGATAFSEMLIDKIKSDMGTAPAILP